MPLLGEFPGMSLWVIAYAFDLCFVYPRRNSSSDHLSQPFCLHVIYGALSLTPLLLFIRLQTNQHPRPRPKAQYMILGPYPYNTHTYTHTHTYIYIYYPCFSLFHISLPNSNLKQNNFIIFWENKTAPKFKINEIYIKKTSPHIFQIQK